MTQFLKDITIRRMILCTLLTISVLLAGQSAISVKGLQSSGEALAASYELLNEVSSLSRVNDQIMRARLRLARQMEYVRDGLAAPAAEEGRAIDAALEAARKNQAAFLESAKDSAPASILEPLQGGFNALVNDGIAIQRGFLAAEDLEKARAHAAGPVIAASRAFGKAIENYEAYAQERQDALRNSAQRERQQAYTGIGVLLGVCLLLLVLGDRYVVRFVRQPLDQVKRHFQHIAAGDLTAPIAPYGRNCVGQLIPYLQEMQASLVRTVHAVRDGVAEINTGSSEIAAGNQDLSSRTEQQAASSKRPPPAWRNCCPPSPATPTTRARPTPWPPRPRKWLVAAARRCRARSPQCARSPRTRDVSRISSASSTESRSRPTYWR